MSTLTLQTPTIRSAFIFCSLFFILPSPFFLGDIFIQTSLVLMQHENCAHIYGQHECVLYLLSRNVDTNGSDLCFPTCTNLRLNALKGFSVTKINSERKTKKSNCDILSHFKQLPFEVTVRQSNSFFIFLLRTQFYWVLPVDDCSSDTIWIFPYILEHHLAQPHRTILDQKRIKEF